MWPTTRPGTTTYSIWKKIGQGRLREPGENDDLIWWRGYPLTDLSPRLSELPEKYRYTPPPPDPAWIDHTPPHRRSNRDATQTRTDHYHQACVARLRCGGVPRTMDQIHHRDQGGAGRGLRAASVDLRGASIRSQVQILHPGRGRSWMGCRRSAVATVVWETS